MAKLFKKLLYRYSKERIEKIEDLNKQIEAVETDIDAILYAVGFKIDPKEQEVKAEHYNYFSCARSTYDFSVDYNVIGSILYEGLRVYKKKLIKERDRLL